MKLLFIHEVNYETKVIFEIQEFPELLALRGHQIDFLQFPEHVGIRKSRFRTNVKKIQGRVYPAATLNLITPMTFGGSFLDRLMSTITVIPNLLRLISKEKYDAIILYSVPTSGWQTALIAKYKKVPVIFRALDVSHLLRSGLTKKLVKVAERIVYRNVSLISANNSALGNYCVQISGEPQPMTVNVPPLDFAHFQKMSKKTLLREKYKLKDNDFVLVFMGTFYEFSGIDCVLKDLAQNNDQSIKILLVGGGKQEAELIKLVSELNLSDRVLFTGVIPYDELPDVLSIADVAFNSFDPILISNVAFPHKVLQYLAAGIPTVSTKLDGLYVSLNDDAGVKWVTKPSEVLQAALELRKCSKIELDSMIALGKKFIAQNFDKNESVISLEKTIEKVILNNDNR